MTNQSPDSQKLISVVMATYNCGIKVINTIESVLSQNSQLFELIVIDGVSSDGTLELIEKYKQSLTLISEPDQGIYDAFNKALDVAQGQYIYFIGAGDCLKDNIFEEVKDHLPLDEVALVYGNVYFAQSAVFNGKEFDAKLFVRDNLCQQGMFYHRDIFRLVGKFDLRFKVLSDWYFNLNCFMNQEIHKKYVNLVIADYEQGGVSSDIKNDPEFLREFPRFVYQNFGFYQYVMCKAFLKNPNVFNYIMYREFYWLTVYLVYRYPVLKKSVSFIRSQTRRKMNSIVEEETIAK